jgi:hypothetical protein
MNLANIAPTTASLLGKVVKFRGDTFRVSESKITLGYGPKARIKECLLFEDGV